MAVKTKRQNEKKTAGRSKMSILLSLIVLGFVCYLSISYITTQIDVNRKKQELAAVQQQIDTMKVENEELSQILENEDDAAYMERIAREKLGYVAPDEYVYIDSAGS